MTEKKTDSGPLGQTDGRLERSSTRVSSQVPTGWWNRTGRTSVALMGTAARLGKGAVTRWVTGDGTSDELRAAQRLLEQMGHLKGALMKVGQMLSYMDGALPESARNVLSGLQDNAPPMAPDVVAAVVEQELGGPPHQVFAEWESTPFAAASIGQVHRAQLTDGRKVAVKVQYPGIVEALKTDLTNVAMMSAFNGVVFRGINSKEIVSEFRERLLEECDYRVEAKNYADFRRFFLPYEDVLVPDVVVERSTERVLTIDFVEGQKFGDFLQKSSQDDRNRVGVTLFRVAFESIFQHHAFNCDPHPGNYLIRPTETAFIDFGCVKRYTPQTVQIWRNMLQSVVENDRPRFEQSILDIGMARKRNGFDFDYQHKIALYLYRPWLTEGKFRYSHEYVAESFRLLAIDNPNKFKMNMPREMVFVNRLQWGLNSILASLNVEADFRSIMIPLIYGHSPHNMPNS